MPGANYMGGKRNAMKARVKDTVGRQQKGHFWRQRLDILAKGICATKPSEIASHWSRSSAPEINLAHARKKIPLNNADDTSSERSFISSPIHITPSTPRSTQKRTRRASEAHTSSSATSTRSKLLDTLDLSEPLFLRRLMDQIVAMPNLACLTDRNPPGSAPRVHDEANRKVYGRSNSPRKERIRKLSIDGELENPRRKLVIDEEPASTRCPRFEKPIPCTPPQRQRTLKLPYSLSRSDAPQFWVPQSSNYHNYSLYAHSEGRNRLEDEDGIDEDDVLQFDGAHDRNEQDEPGIDENELLLVNSEEDDDMHLSSTLWSPVCDQNSSRTSFYSDAFLPEEQPPLVRPASYSQASSEDLSEAMPEEQPMDRIPSVILLGACQTKSRAQTAYGSLFTQEDPWSTIGMILGLPKTGKTKVSAQKLHDEELISTMLPNTLTSASSACKERPEEDFGGYDVQPSDDSMESVSEFELQSVPKPRREGSDHNHAASSVISGSILDYILGLSPPNHEVDIVINDVEVGESVGDNPAHNASSDNANDVADLACAPHVEEGQEYMQADVPNQVVDEGEMHLLGAPDLQEVDGRFLGPSLFDDFAESDEDLAD